MIYSKEEIQKGLEESFAAMAILINSLDKQAFETCVEGKWSAGQQLDHLIKSVQPINKVLVFPKFFFKMVFGRMNRNPRTFEELLTRYNEKLAKGGKASSPFVPPLIPFVQRDIKVKQFHKELNKLVSHLNSLTDRQLDSLLLPHPLLGKLNLREMMFFTIFHTKHHYNIIVNQVG